MATASGGKEEQKVADFDELVDEIIARKGPAKYQDGLSENNWEEVDLSLTSSHTLRLPHTHTHTHTHTRSWNRSHCS